MGPGSRLVSDLSSVSIPFQASGTLSCLSGPLCLLGCPSASVDSSCCDSVSLFCPVCVSGLYSSAYLLLTDGNLPPHTLVTPALPSCLSISRSPGLYGSPHRACGPAHPYPSQEGTPGYVHAQSQSSLHFVGSTEGSRGCRTRLEEDMGKTSSGSSLLDSDLMQLAGKKEAIVWGQRGT